MKDFFSLTLCKQLNIAGVPCSILDDLRQGKCVTPSEERSVAKDKPPIHNHTFKHSVSDSKLGQIHFIQMRNESIPFPYAFFKIHLTPFQRQENVLSILTATNSFFLYFNHRIQIQCIINFLPSAKSVDHFSFRQTGFWRLATLLESKNRLRTRSKGQIHAM